MKLEQATDKDILDVVEAAEIVGCCERTMKQLLRDGVLPGIKLGKGWRVPRAELVRELSLIAVTGLNLKRQALNRAHAALNRPPSIVKARRRPRSPEGGSPR
ncbi:helix-turn-helix domain-containing protein [uncultured Ramlibacter sp.]|uniref:helix-turn-helix domain-containing protein n=1 Tax=uncultured Ramlibacter sp. TaxID=260755 RepID=UPI0026210F34|nr:helix-turn-helix domain-containing protein [uncultured Ramlibacter sp.]